MYLEGDMKSVLTKPATYYQGRFMYMRYTQGQNEEYLLALDNISKLIQNQQYNYNYNCE